MASYVVISFFDLPHPFHLSFSDCSLFVELGWTVQNFYVSINTREMPGLLFFVSELFNLFLFFNSVHTETLLMAALVFLRCNCPCVTFNKVHLENGTSPNMQSNLLQPRQKRETAKHRNGILRTVPYIDINLVTIR